MTPSSTEDDTLYPDEPRNQQIRRAIPYAGGIAFFILVWWGGSRLAGPAILPSPLAVAAYLAEPGVIPDFVRNALRTIGRGVLGFSFAWIVALPVGLLMGRVPFAGRFGFFPVFLLQGAPPLFWITPLVLWLGTSGIVAPVMAMLVTFPLLVVHTAAALRSIAAFEYDVFTVYARSRRAIVRELYLPRLLPAIKSNVNIGVLVAIKAAMLAEWFAAQDGFGRRINIFYQFFAVKEFMGWAILFLFVIGLVSFLVHRAADRLLPSMLTTEVSPESDASGRDRGATMDKPSGQDHGDRCASPTSPGTIGLSHISFSYSAQPLIDDLSLEINPGRPVALYGPSGCGKTTLLKIATGLIQPQAGTVIRPKRVGLVFQEDALLSHRDALGNVLLPRLPHIAHSDIEEASACLSQWGLGDVGHRFPHELSGGMRKRLAMARAWFLRPDALLLDEPFVNLDRPARDALWSLFFAAIRELAIPTLIVTHYPDEVARFDVNLQEWPQPQRSKPNY